MSFISLGGLHARRGGQTTSVAASPMSQPKLQFAWDQEGGSPRQRKSLTGGRGDRAGAPSSAAAAAWREAAGRPESVRRNRADQIKDGIKSINDAPRARHTAAGTPETKLPASHLHTESTPVTGGRCSVCSSPVTTGGSLLCCLPSPDLNVTWLGTSSAIPTGERNVSCTVVRVHDALYLVDCGEGSHRQLQQANVDPAEIEG